MIKLYTVPGTCSLAPHIILKETALPHEIEVLKRGGSPEGWAELQKLNAMGLVPAIITEEGYPLFEATAILQYLNQQSGENLFPSSGKERFKAFEWLNFIATELHKGFGPLFKTSEVTSEENCFAGVKTKAHESLNRKLKVAETRFEGPEYTVGDHFSVVDAYLYVVLSWSKYAKVDLAPYGKLTSFVQKTAQRPSVIAASKAEGLIK